MKHIVLFLTIVVLSVLFASPTHAFDCGAMPAEYWFTQADVVFSGKVIEKKLVVIGKQLDYFYVASFKVERVYKGEVKDTASVGSVHVSNGPGVVFLCGEEYMVYGKKTSGLKSAYSDLWTTVCTPTRPLKRDVPDTDTLENATYFDSPGYTKEERDKYWKWMDRCLKTVDVSVEKYCAGDRECLDYFVPLEGSGSPSSVINTTGKNPGQ